MDYGRILYTIYKIKEKNIKEGSWRVKQESFEDPQVPQVGRVKAGFSMIWCTPLAGFQPDRILIKPAALKSAPGLKPDTRNLV